MRRASLLDHHSHEVCLQDAADSIVIVHSLGPQLMRCASLLDHHWRVSERLTVMTTHS